jgi:hypothetical protein
MGGRLPSSSFEMRSVHRRRSARGGSLSRRNYPRESFRADDFKGFGANICAGKRWPNGEKNRAPMSFNRRGGLSHQVGM